MLLRQRITTYGITTTAIAAIGLAAWLKPWKTSDMEKPVDAIEQPSGSTHRVDVVFAVDTTGSMGNLLDGAKRTVWSIATHIKQTDPSADLHVGLVAYRDLGENYVTKDFPLSGDMDAVFAELSSYVAAGGGDVPEDVDAGIYDAVHKMAWRDGATKLMFVVGDAPPASRGDVPNYDVTIREAAAMQIRVNAIRCGQDPDTAQAWQTIASLGNGEFSTIRQDGGVNQMATPYDDKIRALSTTIDNSAVIYGDSSIHAAYRVKVGNAMAAPAATASDRAAWYGKGARDGNDVLTKVNTGSLSIDGLDPSNLPSDMQGMDEGKLKAEFARRGAERAQAQKELDDLQTKRADYLQANKGTGEGGFDDAVNATVTRELK